MFIRTCSVVFSSVKIVCNIKPHNFVILIIKLEYFFSLLLLIAFELELESAIGTKKWNEQTVYLFTRKNYAKSKKVYSY